MIIIISIWFFSIEICINVFVSSNFLDLSLFCILVYFNIATPALFWLLFALSIIFKTFN